MEAIDRPDHVDLFGIASSQMGYFTAEQARAVGFYPQLLQHNVRSGRFLRVRRGLYRFRDYPSSPREEVMAAWLAAGKGDTVVSHETALDILDLSDVIPNSIHLTVPRTKHRSVRSPGVTIHSTVRPLGPRDVVTREGMRVTAPVRTILDSAEWGIGPEQIEMAIHQALERGMTTVQQVEDAAEGRPRRIRDLVQRSLREAQR